LRGRLNNTVRSTKIQGESKNLIKEKMPADERKVVIISSPTKYEDLMRGINWKSLEIDYLQVGLKSLIPFYGQIKTAKLLTKVFKGEYASKIPYPVYDLAMAKEFFDFTSDIPIPTEVGALNIGVTAGGKSSHNIMGRLAFTFGESNAQVREVNTPWLKSEPTWQSMIDLRKSNALKSYAAEFNYRDEMGVNGDLIGKMKGLGVSIGGNYKEFKSVKLKYNVVFW